MIKQIVGGLVLAGLTAGSICGVVYGCKYNDLNNSNLTAIEENAELHSTIEELNILTDGLIESNEKLTARIKELNAQLDNKDTTIQDLQTQAESLQTQLKTVQAELAATQSELDEANAENEDHLVQLALYETQIQNLNNEITRLTGLLEAYEDIANETFAVSFYVEEQNLNLATTAVKTDACVTEVPTSSNTLLYRIDGWKLEDGTSVDPLTYPITASTTFYADISYRCEKSIPQVSGGAAVSTLYVKAEDFTFPTVNLDNYAGYTFKGWYESSSPDVLYQPGETYPYFHTNTTRPIFVALFVYEITSTFMNGTETVTTVSLDCPLNGTVKLTSNQIPTVDHKYFIGWKLEDGTEVDLSTYAMKENTIFYANIGEALLFTFSGEVVTGYTGSATDITIPSSYSIASDGTYFTGNDYAVTTISTDFKDSLSGVANVIISEGITTISASAFSRSDIATIFIPSSVVSLDSSALYFCSSLITIYYAGSEDEWNNLMVSELALEGIEIIYNYTGDTSNSEL